MAKREINVFNVSFLDLLSGALGAVLILFIVIPKLTGDIKIKLQELEQIKELKLDVEKIENMMKDLKESVPEDVYAQVKTKMDALEAQVKKLQTTAVNLEAEVKSLQSKLAECDQQRTKLREEVKQLKEKVKELESKLENNGTLVEQLKQEIEQKEQKIKELEQVIQKCENDKVDLQETIEEKDVEIKDLEQDKATLEKEIKKLQDELKKAQETISQQSKEIAQYKERLGFEFSDKNVVFVVDISGSMDDDPEPQKLDEVKAGIKMMIATMDDGYNVDIVIFPKSKNEFYGYKYGKLTPATTNTKYDIYNYLSDLRAHGCTPTRQTMEFVFDNPSYKSAGTVIFLSDGLPTKRISDTACDNDDTQDVLSFIKSKNGGAKVINTIGVGKEFRTQSSTDAKVKFMKDMASQNGGFYIGF